MSAFEQIKSSAESAIMELETEIRGLEEKIESHKMRILSAKVQIQALKRFLHPEENGQEVPKTAKPSKKNGKAHMGDQIELQ